MEENEKNYRAKYNLEKAMKEFRDRYEIKEIIEEVGKEIEIQREKNKNTNEIRDLKNDTLKFKKVLLLCVRTPDQKYYRLLNSKINSYIFPIDSSGNMYTIDTDNKKCIVSINSSLKNEDSLVQNRAKILLENIFAEQYKIDKNCMIMNMYNDLHFSHEDYFIENSEIAIENYKKFNIGDRIYAKIPFKSNFVILEGRIKNIIKSRKGFDDYDNGYCEICVLLKSIPFYITIGNTFLEHRKERSFIENIKYNLRDTFLLDLSNHPDSISYFLEYY